MTARGAQNMTPEQRRALARLRAALRDGNVDAERRARSDLARAQATRLMDKARAKLAEAEEYSRPVEEVGA